MKNQYLIQHDVPRPETTCRGSHLTLYEDELQGCEGGSFVAKVQNAAADAAAPRSLKPMHGIHQGLSNGHCLL